MKRLRLVYALVAQRALGIGCHHAAMPRGANMTPALIAAKGTHTFKGEKAKVLVAAQGALRAPGYEIAFSDGDAGVIKTGPKDLGTTGASAGTQTQYTHQSRVAFMTAARSGALRLTSEDGGGR